MRPQLHHPPHPIQQPPHQHDENQKQHYFDTFVLHQRHEAVNNHPHPHQIDQINEKKTNRIENIFFKIKLFFKRKKN